MTFLLNPISGLSNPSYFSITYYFFEILHFSPSNMFLRNHKAESYRELFLKTVFSYVSNKYHFYFSEENAENDEHVGHFNYNVNELAF